MRGLIALLICGLPASVLGWSVVLGKAAPARLATDRRGDVVAASLVRLPRGSGTCDVAKLDRIDGHVRWRHRINGGGREQSTEVGDLVVAGDGDPIFAGTIEDAHGGEDFAVVRLAGETGSERWRSKLQGLQPEGVYNAPRAAVVDTNGDVVVAGTVQNAPAIGGNAADYGDFAVAKLAGHTGTELWRFVFSAPLVPLGTGGFSSQEADADVVAVDAAGDVIAAGTVFGVDAKATISVVKLSGTTGQLLWRHDLDIAWRTSALAIDPAGDAVLAVSTQEQDGNDFGVVKLSGGTGDLLWVDRESASVRRWQEAVRVLVDASGAVFASGMTDDGAGSAAGPTGYLFTVVRLDGATGARVWAFHTEGTAGGGFAHHLQFGSPGLVIAGGSTEGTKTCEDVRVVALDTETGTAVWSKTFDGTFVAKYGCSSDNESPGGGPPIDNDELGSMITDTRGRIFAGITLTNRTSAGVRSFGFLRRLSVRRSG